MYINEYPTSHGNVKPRVLRILTEGYPMSSEIRKVRNLLLHL